MMKEMMNISMENKDAILHSFLHGESWQTVPEISRVISFLPFAIVFRPQMTPITVDVVAGLVNKFPVPEQRELRQRILKRLIHPFLSKVLLDGYTAIVSFLTVAVKKKLFKLFEVANAVFDLMTVYPKCSRIFVEFFFWFGPVFEQFSHNFVASLRRYVEIEYLARTLPRRYADAYKQMDELMANGWEKYQSLSRMKRINKAIQFDNVKKFTELMQKRPNVNFRLKTGLFERAWILFDSPTVAQYCAFFGAEQCLEYLIQRKVDLDMTDAKGRHIFEFAVAGSQVDMIKRFMPSFSAKAVVSFHQNHLLQLASMKKDDMGKYVVYAICANNLEYFIKAVVNRAIGDMFEMAMCDIESESAAITFWIIRHAPKLDWNRKCKNRTALHMLIRTNQISILSRLLKNPGVDTEILDSEGHTPLQLATTIGNADAVAELLACDRVKVNVRWPDGRSILHEAILRTGLGCVKCILACERFDVNSVDEDGETAMHTVTSSAHTKGTHIHIQGDTAQDKITRDSSYIMSFGRLVYVEILTLLCDCPRVNVNILDKEGWAPIHYAAKYGRFDFIKILEKKRPDLDINIQTRREKWTILHIAPVFGRIRTAISVKQRKNLEKNLVDTNGRTAINLASATGRPEILRSLSLDADIDFDIPDKWNRTMMHSAAVNGNATCIRAVGQSERLRVNHQDGNGLTALDIAENYGYPMCARLLRLIEQNAATPE